MVLHIDSKFSSVESNNNELPTFKPTNIQDGESKKIQSFTKPDNESISTNMADIQNAAGPSFILLVNHHLLNQVMNQFQLI